MKYRNFAPLLALAAGLVWTVTAFAGGSDPDVSKPVAPQDKGTNVKGQSSDFNTYVNEPTGDKESNSIDLVDLGEDTKVAAGGDDSSVGLRAKY